MYSPNLQQRITVMKRCEHDLNHLVIGLGKREYNTQNDVSFQIFIILKH